MKEYKPYTYIIGWSKLQKFYYGVEYAQISKTANPENLWNSYFTSSNIIDAYRKEFGEPDIIQVRKVFNTKEEAVKWETKFLQKVDARHNPLFINEHNSDGLGFKRSFVSQETRLKSSIALTGKVRTDEHKEHYSIGRSAYYETEKGQTWLEELRNLAITNNYGDRIKGWAGWNKGIPNPQEVNDKISIGLKEYWEDNEEAHENRSLLTKQMWEDGVFDNRPYTPRASSKRNLPEIIERKFKANARIDYIVERHRIEKENKLSKRTLNICGYCGYENYHLPTFRAWHGEKCKHNLKM